MTDKQYKLYGDNYETTITITEMKITITLKLINSNVILEITIEPSAYGYKTFLLTNTKTKKTKQTWPSDTDQVIEIYSNINNALMCVIPNFTKLLQMHIFEAFIYLKNFEPITHKFHRLWENKLINLKYAIISKQIKSNNIEKKIDKHITKLKNNILNLQTHYDEFNTLCNGKLCVDIYEKQNSPI
jgi:hypothetical protein